MAVDRRSYAWWVNLVAYLEDAHPHFNGRSQRRRFFRTRAEAKAYYDKLLTGTYPMLRLVSYPSGTPNGRRVTHWRISWGATKTYDSTTTTGVEEPEPVETWEVRL